MVRALWTGASGMNAQQVSLDNIANNLANVNTTGYKKQTTEFSSLLYQKLQRIKNQHLIIMKIRFLENRQIKKEKKREQVKLIQ